MKKNLITLIVVSVVALLILLFSLVFSNRNEKVAILKINNTQINIEVADNDLKREKGLSGRVEIAKDEGMLFVFEREDYYGFWMKDMNFPIDIAWLDKNKKIVHIENSVSPETYSKKIPPKVFKPNSPSLYVL